MPLVAAGQTEGWKFHLQLTDGSKIRSDSANILQFAGPTINEPVNAFQDSTHIITPGGTHVCATVHGQNTRRNTDTTASINGANPTALPIPTANCALMLSFFSLEEITTAGSIVHGYNGADLQVSPLGTNIYLAEGGVSTS
jgi:hypothetical protein